MRLAFLSVTALLLVPRPAVADGDLTRYDRVLAANGVKPTPQGILEYLSPLSAERLNALIAQLGDASYARREEATRLLSSLPAVPSDALHKAAVSSDPEVRYRAKLVIERNRKGRNSSVMFAALKRIRGKKYAQAAPVVLELIPQFAKPEMVSAAAEALFNVAGKSHLPLLRKTLYASTHTPQRTAVLRTMAAVGGKEILPDLRKLQSDKDEQLQLAAAFGLLRFGEREGLKTLAKLLSSQDIEIRAAAAGYLRAATGKRFGFLAIDQSPARQRAATAWEAWVAKNGATAKLHDISPQMLITTHATVTGGRLLEKFTSHNSTAYCVAFSPDGKLLASCSGDRTVKVWNVATGKLQWEKLAHDRTVRAVAFSPTGKIIASSSYDNTVRLWDVKTRKHIRTLAGHTGSLRITAFSPDGKMLATTSDDTTVRLWDVASGKTLRVLKGHRMTVRSVAFGTDGRVLASCGSDNTVRLWDVKTGSELKVLTGHTSSVRSVAFSPDDRTLVSCSLDNTVRLWDVKSGKERVTLRGHSLSVKSVAFESRGRYIASGGNDRIIRIWDPSTGKLATTLSGPTSSVWHVAVSPDGKLVAACGSDRSVYVWKLEFSVGP